MLPMLLLAGCFHFHKTNQSQTQPLAPPVVNATPSKPAPGPDLTPPIATPPADIPPIPTPPPPEVKKQPVKHKKPAAAPQPASTTQQASIPNPGVSAIGQLSTGDPSDVRQQTLNSIAATERGLSALNHNLSDGDKKTADHIIEFLKKAKDALNTGDVDGAATLAAKAKVLLGELSK